MCIQKQATVGFEIKSVSDDGVFAGYASVFNVVDDQFDVILPRAFGHSIQSRTQDIKLLWQHKADEPIGYFTQVVEDEHGLFVEGRLLLDVERAKEAHALLKSGALKGMSIGYSIVKAHFDENEGVRYIEEVDLWEVSLVTFPANVNATVAYVKGSDAPRDIRSFERFLRESGYSRNEAKMIACKGFNSACGERGDMANLMRSIEQAQEIISPTILI